MFIYKIISKMKKRVGYLSSPKTVLPHLWVLSPQVDECSLQYRNIVISGEFFPGNECTFKENLLKGKARIQFHLTSETEILICGKYPDWELIEEAKRKEVKIIFVDKISDLFMRFCPHHPKSRSDLFGQVPLGI